MRRRLLLPLAMAGLVALSPGAAHAAWTAPAEVIPPAPGLIESPDVQAIADGSAILTYTRGGHVFAAIKSPAQGFAGAQDLGTGSNVQLAVNASGQAVLAWADGAAFRFATRQTGGPIVKSPNPTSFAGGPIDLDTAISASGQRYITAIGPTGATLYGVDPSSPNSIVLTTFGATNPTSVSIGLQTGTDSVWFMTTSKNAGVARAYAARWSPTTGSVLSLLSSETDTAAPATYVFSDARVVDGPQPTFLWSAVETTGGGGSTFNQLRSRATPLGTTVTFTLATGNAPFLVSYFRTSPAVSYGADGSSVIAWGARTTVTGLPSAPTYALTQRPAGGSFGPALPMPGLSAGLAAATASPAITAAPRRGAASRLSYTGSTASGRSVLSVGLNSAATVEDATPFVVATDPTIDEVFSAGTTTGDTATIWTSTAPGGGQLATIRLDDENAPELTVATPTSPTKGDTAVDRTVAFDASATDAWSGMDGITWDFGDGSTAVGGSVSHAFPAAGGTFAVRATARDKAGNATTKTVSVSVPVPPAPPTPTTPAGTELATLSALKLSAKSFAATKGKVAKAKTKGKKKTPAKGATLSLTLSAAAKLELRVSRITRGYKVGKSCKATKPKNKPKAKRCDLLKAAGTVAVDGKTGANAIAFSGVVGGKKLGPGKYQLVITPAGGKPSAPLKFTILKG